MKKWSMVEALAAHVALAGDSESARSEKGLLLLFTVMAGLIEASFLPVWWAMHMENAAIMVLISTLAFFLNAYAFTRHKNSQLCLHVALGLALASVASGMVLMGGHLPVLSMTVWAAAVPLVAAAFTERPAARLWLAASLLFTTPFYFFHLSEPALLTDAPDWLDRAFFAINIGGLMVTGFIIFARMTSERRAALDALSLAHQKSESLLLNVLPASIAQRLKLNPGTIAERFDDVTILFADIVGFTSLSARIGPEELVAMLDDIFSGFDALADRYGLEKIKTIGDAYMVVGGLPLAQKDHAHAVADMALGMLDVVARHSARMEQPLSVRVGVHSGPAVAGVIGRRKFIYDLWGDAVNTASRMESHSQPGFIQVSDATRALIESAFELQPRGTVDVKGKGPMETFFLLRRKTP